MENIIFVPFKTSLLLFFARNFVDEYKYAFHDNECNLITDAEGNKPKTRWLSHVRR